MNGLYQKAATEFNCHEGIAGNGARTGSEPACDISFGVGERAVNDCMNKKHMKQRESITGLKQAKELILGTSAKRSKDLPKLIEAN
jgi:hypothetical protein